MTTDETTKDLSEEKNSQMPVVRKQSSAAVVPAKPNAVVVYEEPEAAPEKKGFFGKSGRKSVLSSEQLIQLIQENIQAFPEHERQFLRAIFDLKTLTAQEVMVPLSEIVPLTVDSPCSEIPQYYRASSYRYIPVYNERVDWLIGVVDTLEIATSEQPAPDLAIFVKEACYAPAPKSALDLLNELRQSEIPIAIVVNEHGSCIGIVELIDILEKIVGNIATNRKRETPHVEQLEANEWRIDARVLISEVNTALDTDISTDRCNTIGGFVFMLLGRLPEQGETIEYENLEFNVEEVFKYRISGIRILKKTEQ
ncbi:MAG: CBS domain-containing protein [Candidatus Poribacteria bacterium]|nr:CBS domain-containing protein [Candidatus Poribacteria bacterium]